MIFTTFDNDWDKYLNEAMDNNLVSVLTRGRSSSGVGTTDIEAADDWCDQMLDRLGVAA